MIEKTSNGKEEVLKLGDNELKLTEPEAEKTVEPLEEDKKDVCHDFFGDELKRGDKVIFIPKTGRVFALGTVLGISPASVWVDDGVSDFARRNPKMVIKTDRLGPNEK